MALEFHVIQRRVLGDPNKKKKYYATTSIRSEVTLEDLTDETEQTSTVSGADIRAVVYSLVDNIPHHLADGDIVRLGDFGSFRMSMSSNGEENEEDVDIHSIKGCKIVFTPGKKFIDMLKTIRYKKKQ